MPVSQYAYVNDTVTFDCATNLTGYILLFNYDAEVSVSASLTKLNGGKKIIASIMATSQLNGTVVTCRAVSQDNVATMSKPTYIYVQG